MGKFSLKSFIDFFSLSWKQIIKVMTIILITFSFFSCSFLSKADTQTAIEIDPQLEAQVLQIIRNNPETILQSVEDYQNRQIEQQQQQRQSLLDKMKNDSQSFIGESPVLGNKSAKLIMFEFSDFQCPYCARASATLKTFMDKHGNEIRLVYKHLPLVQIHPQATPSAKASWAAAKQGKFWEYHDALFSNQNRLGEELYGEIAQSLNLNLDRFNSDRNSTNAQKAVDEDIKLAMELELSGTPTFVLNGELFSGALSLSDFEAKLAQAQQN
jgi:protein-disulfide isomerase